MAVARMKPWVRVSKVCEPPALRMLTRCLIAEQNGRNLMNESGVLLIAEWTALYTTQLTQKAKKFHDGVVRLAQVSSHVKQVSRMRIS